MGDQHYAVNPEKGVEASTISTPPPANPETILDNLPSHTDADMGWEERSVEKTTEKPPLNKAKQEFPSTKRVIPIVAALYMAFFLVALVSIPYPLSVRSMLTKIRTAQ